MFGHMIVQLVGRYGYPAVAVGVLLESAGLPVPGEAALLAASFASAQGLLSLPVVIAVGAVSGILGDNLGYWMGRRLGRPWLEKHGRRFLLTPKQLHRVEQFFDRYGPAAVALARFLAGVRVIAAFWAGAARMKWSKFLFYNATGAIAWATTVGVGGYLFGASFKYLSESVGLAGGIAIAAVALGGAIIWIVRRGRRRGNT